ncbi:MAG: hypothetical protein ABFS10_02965 [Bacteroidota bacterium]
MKKLYPYSLLILVASFILSVSLSAQETTVKVKVIKDGKVETDTTYTFDDADEATHALKMMEMMSGEEVHMMKVHKDMKEHDCHHAHGGHAHGEHVMVMKSEDCEGDSLVKKKIVKVMISDDEEIEWHSDDEDLKHVEEEVYITKDGDEEVEVIVIKKRSKKQ